MYQKESDKQKERIQKLIDTGADSHDISKQVGFITRGFQSLADFSLNDLFRMKYWMKLLRCCQIAKHV